MNAIDNEWNQYLFSQGLQTYERENIKTKIENISQSIDIFPPKIADNDILPKCNELVISTKTKVLFLNTEVDIHKIFWEIPIIEYGNPTTGVLKKQIKVVSKTEEEYQEYRKKTENIPYFKEHIIKKITNPVTTPAIPALSSEKEESRFRISRRIRFKDERKITIGISKKDIMNCRVKAKNAFYNCFALVIRFLHNDNFKEIHVKVFNTGKLEIPGILNKELFDIIRELILKTLQPHISIKLEFLENKKTENVLINSNFNCGYYINREKLYHILRSDKYGIETSYDPCSYPGVKCKFYFNNKLGFSDSQNGKIILEDRTMKMNDLTKSKKYTEISFMIFRTGSVLIVGNCCEDILNYVFEFVKNILKVEYLEIYAINEGPVIKTKKSKLRKKIINVS